MSQTTPKGIFGGGKGPIVSIFNNLLDTSTQNIAINTTNVDNALSDIKTNFLRANHNISIAKKFLLNQAKDAADDVGGIGEELGTLAAYQLGLISPESNLLKTFKFNFNNKSNINIGFEIPSFNIYDLPPGAEVIDYVFTAENNCDYVGGDIILFPGVPCDFPELKICKKTLTKKICGKRINIGTVEYPCGLRQKTIGSIVLNKDDSPPDVLYNFPGCKFKCDGSIFVTGEMVVEMSTELPISLFTEILKKQDIDTYNSITTNGTKPITDTSQALKLIFNIRPNFQWFLNFAKYAIAFNSAGLAILNICITSIKISSTCSLKYLGANFGPSGATRTAYGKTSKVTNGISINNLSYSENNYELLQKGRYISASISTNADINFEIGLGSYKIGQLFKDTAGDDNFLGLIIKMINSEKNNTPPGIRLRELTEALNFLNGQINSEKLSDIPYRKPNFVNILKNIKTKVDLSLSLSVGVKEPVPVISFNSTICFTFAQIIEFIKKYLSDFIVDALLSSVDGQMFLANIELRAIEYVIKPFSIPNSITNIVDKFNKKFDYARNLFKGYVTIGIMESTSFLQKIITDKNTTYSYTFSCPV